jgi:hypothetical protein
MKNDSATCHNVEMRHGQKASIRPPDKAISPCLNCVPISNSEFSCVNPQSGSITRGTADVPRSPSKPHVFPITGWENIDPSIIVEEESIPTYRPEKYYPVRIGEVFNDRYRVVGKLGFGSSTTVWLCRDLL